MFTFELFDSSMFSLDWFVFQVLEIGIVVHSVIIGISLGTAQSIDTIKPLLVALSFHQFFEGMGLGGCISQVKLQRAFVINVFLLVGEN